MAEETIKCPKCGTENSTDDKYCKECGKNLSSYILPKESLTKALLFPVALEIITFLVVAIICGFAFGYFVVRFPSEIPMYNDSSTLLQLIYDEQNKLGITLCLFLGSLIGAMVVFCTWSVFKFNRIERRIVETQEMINKRG